MIGKDVNEGKHFVGRTKEVTQDRISAFSGGFPRSDGWPKKNIHTDLAFAQACGLSAQAASGAMFEGYLSELMIELFGVEWLRRGRMSLVFVKTVPPGERLTPKATVRERTLESTGVRVLLDVWCEDSTGSKVVVGTSYGYVV
jgi:acyl dehydratase